MVSARWAASGLVGVPGCPIGQALVGAFVAVVLKERLQPVMTIGSRRVLLEVDVLVLQGCCLRGRHRRSIITLSIARPLPSMLMAIDSAVSRPVNCWLVNCDPWSVLKTPVVRDAVPPPAPPDRTPRPCCSTVCMTDTPTEPAPHRRQVQVTPLQPIRRSSGAKRRTFAERWLCRAK